MQKAKYFNLIKRYRLHCATINHMLRQQNSTTEQSRKNSATQSANLSKVSSNPSAGIQSRETPHRNPHTPILPESTSRLTHPSAR